MASYGDLSIGVRADTRAMQRSIASAAVSAGTNAGRSIGTRVGSSLAGIGKTVSKAFAYSIGGAVAATGGLAASAIKAGASYNILSQTSMAAFKTILGSGKAASAMMNDIAAFAKTSPFPRQAFIEAAQTMLSFGMTTKQSKAAMVALNDVVAATGRGSKDIGELSLVMGQISAAGKITGQDLMQFGQRGIDAASLIGSQMGKTGAQIRTQITKGTLDAQVALNALITGMGKKYAGAAKNVKQTWVGATDRIKGAMRDIGSAIVEPFISKTAGGVAVDWANKIADMFRALEKLVGPVMTAMGKALGGPLSKLSPLLENITKRINNLANYAPAVDKFSRSFGDLLPVIGALAAGFATFASKGLLAAIPGLGGFAGALNPVTAGLIALVGLSPQLRGVVGEFGRALKPAGAALKGLGTTMLDTFSGLIKQITPALTSIARSVGSTFASIANAIAPVVGAIAGDLAGAFARIMPVIAQLVGAAGKLISELVSRLAPAFGNVAGAVLQAGGPFDTFTSMVAGAVRIILDLVKQIAPAVGSIARTVGSTFASVASAIVPVAAAIARDLAGAFARLMPVVAEFASAAGRLVSEVVSRLAPAFGTLARELLRAGGPFDAILSLAGAATSVVSGLTPVLSGVASIVGVLARAFGSLPGPIQTVLALLVVSKFTGITGSMGRLASTVSGSVVGSFRRFGDQMRVQQSLARMGSQSMDGLGDAAAGSGRRLGGFGAAAATAGAQVGAAARGGFRSLVGALGGPMGLAITGATIGLGLLMQNQQKAAQRAAEHKAAVDAVTQALEQSNGAMDESVAKALMKSNADAKNSALLGMAGSSQKEYTTALLGSKAAQEAYLAKLAQTDHLTKTGMFSNLSLTKSFKDQVNVLSGAKAQYQQQRQVTDAIRNSTTQANPALKTLTDSMKTFGDATQDAASRANALNSALNVLAGGAGSAEQAQIDAAAANRQLVNAFSKASGASFKAKDAFKGASTQLNQNSDAAKQLSDMMSGQVAPAFSKVVTSAFDAAGGMKNLKGATAAAQKAATGQRQAFLRTAKGMGLNAQQAVALANKYGLIPGNVATLVKAMGIKDETKRAEFLKKAYDKLPKSKQTKLSAPGAKQAKAEMDAATRAANKVPKSKATKFSTPDARASKAAIDAVTSSAKKVPTSKSTKLSAPGAGTTRGQLDKVKQSVWRVPESWTSKISAKNATKPGVDSAKSYLNTVKDKTVWITSKHKSVGKQVAAGLATGGHVRGRLGVDKVPLMATAGEYVIRRAAARSLGDATLAYLNQHGRLPAAGYQHGGHVTIDHGSIRALGMAAGGTVTPMRAAAGNTIIINPRANQSETQIASAVDRKLAWTAGGGER